MRCPKCHAETPPDAAKCPGCNLPTPKGRQDKAREKEREFDRKTKKFFLSGLMSRGKGKNREESSHTKTIIRIAIILVAILATGFGSYLVVFSYWESKQVDPVSAMQALHKLRNMPSNQEGYTVDQVMTAELDKFKANNNLKGYQGWHTKKIRGTESKVIVVFSFQDLDNQNHSAEWLVDVATQNFIPQTELAMSVYNK